MQVPIIRSISLKGYIMKNSTLKILTHDGVFHADEVMAIALLQHAYPTLKFDIFRSRKDTDYMNYDYVVDAGQQHGTVGQTVYLDHHQYDSTDEEFGKASAGMMLDYLNIKGSCPQLDNLIEEIDSQDIGVKRNGENHFSNVISGMNHHDIHTIEQYDAFNQAVILASIIINLIMLGKDTSEALAAQKKINDTAKAKLIDSRNKTVSTRRSFTVNDLTVSILHKDAQFIPGVMLSGVTDILIQYDKGQECWTVQSIPLVKGEFGSKYDIVPQGTDNEIFIHKGGFIAKIREVDGSVEFKISNKEDIETVVKVSV